MNVLGEDYWRAVRATRETGHKKAFKNATAAVVVAVVVIPSTSWL